MKELEYAIPHLKKPEFPVAVFLEVLQPNGRPSLFSMHLAEYEVKEIRKGWLPLQTDYERTNVQTIVYEYDCAREYLRRVAFYFGDFRDPEFSYPACLGIQEHGEEISEMSSLLFSRDVRRLYECLNSEWHALQTKPGQKRETLERFEFFVSLLEKIVEKEKEEKKK